MAKKIDWLEQFATDQYNKMTKTASQRKIATQIIVDRSKYPNAKVGSLVDFDNKKYKIVDTKYRDKSGPGILLEQVTASLENNPACNGEVKPTNGTIPATSTEQSGANCGDCSPLPKTASTKVAAKNDDDFDVLADFDDSKFDESDIANTDVDFGLESNVGSVKEISGPEESEYPAIVSRPGGVKPAPSAPIEGPGKKNVTDAPYHPTFDPGEQYALESLDEWQDAADRTAKAISQEDAQDRTTVEGHYTWNQYIDAILDNDPDDVSVDAGTGMSSDLSADDDLSADNLDSDTTDEDSVDDEGIGNNDDDVDDAVDSLLDDGDGEAAATGEEESAEDTDDAELPDDDFDADLDIPEDFGDETTVENTESSSESESMDTDTDMNTDSDTDMSDLDLPEMPDTDVPDFDADLPAADEEDQQKAAAATNPTHAISRLAYKNRK